MALSAIYGGLVNIILNFILVYVIGIQGACVATVVASFTIFIFRKKAVRNEISIHNYNRILISWVALCAQAILEIYTELWEVEILVILFIIYMHSDGIREICKRVLHYFKGNDKIELT